MLRREALRGKDTAGKGGHTAKNRRGPLALDDARHECTWNGKPVDLTVTEYLLLKALAMRPGHVKNRDQLIDLAYGENIYVDDRTVDSHIKRIRKNSASSIRTSPRSKRSRRRLQIQGRLGKTRRGLFGGLTLRIMAVNMIAPLVLVLGILYTGQYRDSLISADLETLKAHAQLFAEAVSESAIRPVDRGRPFMFAKPEEIEALSPELSRRIIHRLSEATGSHARIFDQNGKILADSLDMGPAPQTGADNGAAAVGDKKNHLESRPLHGA